MEQAKKGEGEAVDIKNVFTVVDMGHSRMADSHTADGRIQMAAMVLFDGKGKKERDL